MADSIVRDFLLDCKSVTEAEVHTFANTIRDNNELIEAIILVLEEKEYHRDFLEPLCEQLFIFFQAQEEALRQFAHFFLPCVIGNYLSSVHRRDVRKSLNCLEILLLGAYNLQILDHEGKPATTLYHIPSISKPSIYHEPISLPQPQLTENMLSKLEHGEGKATQGPYLAIDSLSASNRLHVAMVLMRVYNQSISTMPQASRASFCKMCSRVVNQGTLETVRRMSFDSSLPGSFAPRVNLNSQVLLEMLQAIYYSMFNGLFALAHQALNDIHRRAMQQMYSDVLVVTSAIKNSLMASQCGQPAEGPMGISVAISPTTSTTTVSKAIITNASFRTKKLPDDIPIPEDNIDNLPLPNDPGVLGIIKEEGEEAPGGAIAGAKAMMHGLPSLPGMRKLVKGITRKDSIDKAAAAGAAAAAASAAAAAQDVKAALSADSQRTHETMPGQQFLDHVPTSFEHAPDSRKSSSKGKETDKREQASTRSSSVSRSTAMKETVDKSGKSDRKEASRKDTSDRSSKTERKEPLDATGRSRTEQNGGTVDSQGKVSAKNETLEPRNGIDKHDLSHDTVGSAELKHLATAENTTYPTNSRSEDKSHRSTQV
ncbi:hyccin isoform X2 [Dermacentor andersoni]|uniref:hyccin isoform X2 n=1 Tax=Dermacentor andersoni TaxID=34620 RepID=UPI0021553E5B|nr:hyccin-like isoform X2 [Dermacentor andersoni]